MEDAAQIRTDTSNPEVATLLMAHALAVRVAMGPKGRKPDLDTYLAAFDKVYKGLKATIVSPAPAGLTA